MKLENKILTEIKFDRGILMEIKCPGTHMRLLKPLSMEEWLKSLPLRLQSSYIRWESGKKKAYDKYCQGLYRSQCRILKQFGIAQRKYAKEKKKYGL